MARAGAGVQAPWYDSLCSLLGFFQAVRVHHAEKCLGDPVLLLLEIRESIVPGLSTLQSSSWFWMTPEPKNCSALQGVLQDKEPDPVEIEKDLGTASPRSIKT